MKDRALDVLKRLTRTFGAFTPGQKAVTLIGIVVLGVGGFLFANWAAAPSYAPLFSNLSATDASAIVDKLNSTGTPYQLSDGGATVLVPQSQVYDLRLKMSGAGLPAQADTGYSLLDKQGLTTSDFMQNVDYQRALEGELNKTIKSISGVQAATVHLALPQKDVFAADTKKPTASVLVTTATGRGLSPDQVQSVVHLVAASVVGLDPNQVTVADATGTVLSAGGGQAASTAGSGRSQQTTLFEQRMDEALQQMLVSVVGPGHAVVKTTADLDYDQTETKTQSYVAPSPSSLALSQSTTSESFTGTGGGAGGVLGPDNIQVPTGTGTGTYSHSTNTQDNAVGMVTETRNAAPGNVRRLSVAVLLDSATAKNVDLSQVQKLVSSAVALNVTRGDTIAVSALPFDQSQAKQAQQAQSSAAKAASQAQLIAMAKTGGMALAIAVLVLVAWRASRKSRRGDLSKGETAALDRIQAVLEKRDSAGAIGDGGPPALGSAEAQSAADALEMQARQRDIAEMVDEQPDEVATLLRGWLAERRA
jgi:flagellar M-ring protein FliF